MGLAQVSLHLLTRAPGQASANDSRQVLSGVAGSSSAADQFPNSLSRKDLRSSEDDRALPDAGASGKGSTSNNSLFRTYLLS